MSKTDVPVWSVREHRRVCASSHYGVLLEPTHEYNRTHHVWRPEFVRYCLAEDCPRPFYGDGASTYPTIPLEWADPYGYGRERRPDYFESLANDVGDAGQFGLF